MKTKQRLYHSIPNGATVFCLALLMLVTACGGQDTPVVEKEDRLELSDKEICIDVDVWKPMVESRATIYEGNAFYEAVKGGGNFTLYAYHQNDDDASYLYHYIPGTRLSYIAAKDIWVFLSGEKEIVHYWPNWGKLSFFAFMPYKDYDANKNTYVTMGEYTNTGGQAINCEMPANVDVDDISSQEYMFAYTPNCKKEDGAVNMHFVHPFSAIYLELKQAHRDLTINYVQFDRIYTKGTYSQTEVTTENTDVSWTPSGSQDGSFKIAIDKTVPNDLNFSTEIGGPYLVMPQTFATNTVITVNYTWKGETKSFDTNLIVTDDEGKPVIDAWKSGKKYTYILDLGDNKEEILFKVLVGPWETGGVTNEIEVE